MPKPGTCEPDAMPYLKFVCRDIKALSPPPNPTTVVQAGQPVEFEVNLGVDGLWAGFLVGEQFAVGHHLERIEDGDRKLLIKHGLQVPPPPDTADFKVKTGPFTTGPGGDLEIPGGFDTATFHIVSHIHFANSFIEPFVACYHDTFLMVT
jgi:hypothetical protein